MQVDQERNVTRAGDTSLVTAADELLAEVAGDDFGSVSPSVYETGRLVQSVPWLAGHPQRVAHLLRTQRPDGGWGAPDGYGLVPTLSATDALLTELDRAAPAAPAQALRTAIDRGLSVLRRPAAATPDTIAVEFVVPWLIERVNAHLARRGTARLHPPADTSPATLDALRAAVRNGRAAPEKLWHSLEVLGDDAGHAWGVLPTRGRVGGSPAATAAWLSGHDDGGPAARAARAYLAAVAARYGGPVPSILPITVFERAWVLATLVCAGVPALTPRDLVDYLYAVIGETGAPAGIGLPDDSDDTAAALHALALAGCPHAVHPLFRYQGEHYFRCFPGERTPSTSTNAHILDALLDVDTSAVPDGDRAQCQAAVISIADWLLGAQQPEGHWWDKWHASPYYATACCATALARALAPGNPALRRAAAWVLGSQRPDGSWGRWQGTVEETAYGVQILTAIPLPGTATAEAIARARRWLLGQPDDPAGWPPLWHDKDLYTPIAVVRAARIAALHQSAPALVARSAKP